MSKNNFCKNFVSRIEKIRKDSLISYIDKPNIQILSNEELFAEGIISIYKYTKEEICFNVNSLYIGITGRSLEMKFYTKTTIKVSGVIECVNFENSNKE